MIIMRRFLRQRQQQRSGKQSIQEELVRRSCTALFVAILVIIMIIIITIMIMIIIIIIMRMGMMVMFSITLVPQLKLGCSST